MGPAGMFRPRTVARSNVRPISHPSSATSEHRAAQRPIHRAAQRLAVALAAVVSMVLILTWIGPGSAGAQTPEGTRPGGEDAALIAGRVEFADGDPAVGVKVSLFTTRHGAARDRYLRPAFSGGDGWYRFDQLAADCYTVLVEAPFGASFDRGASHHEQLSCVDPDQTDDSLRAVLTAGRRGKPFDVNILHIGDHHSHLGPDRIAVDLDAGSGDGEEPAVVEVGGLARVATMVDQRTQQLGRDETITVHTGDALSGTVLYTVFGGAADAAAMNSVCFDLLGLGRQDVEQGQETLQTFLDFLADGNGCRTEVITADPLSVHQRGVDQPSIYQDWAGQQPLEPTAGPVTVRRFAGGTVGFVAVPTVAATGLAAPVDPETETDRETNADAETDSDTDTDKPTPGAVLETSALDRLAASAQASINLLGRRGITNVVLISNIGLANDLALAGRLTDVDAVIGGGSHSLLGDFGSLGLPTSGRYPQRTVNADGDPVCIGHAWHYSRVVGELQLRFDGSGGTSSCDGEAHLLLATIEPDPDTTATIDGYLQALRDLSREALGTVTEELCFTAVPSRTVGLLCNDDVIGDSSRRPADVQLLVAEAIRVRAGDSRIGLVNSGIVTQGIPAGPLAIDETYRLLGGDHTVVRLTLTGAELAATLEEAIEQAIGDDRSPGAYPHASGLRWTYDRSAAAGSRVGDMQVRAGSDGDRWVPVTETERYTVATTGYLAGGGDGYRTFAAAVADGRAERTYLEYSQALVDYIDRDLGGRITPAGPTSADRDRR